VSQQDISLGLAGNILH